MPSNVTSIRTPQIHLTPREIREAGAAHQGDVDAAVVELDSSALSPAAFAEKYNVQLAPGGRLTRAIIDEVKKQAVSYAHIRVATTTRHHVVVSSYGAPRSPTLSELHAAGEQKKSPMARAFDSLGIEARQSSMLSLPDETPAFTAALAVNAMESWIPNPDGSATWTPTLEVSAGKVWHRSQYGQLARLDGREFVLVAHGNNNFVGDVSIDLGGSFGTVTVVVAIHDGDAPGSRLVSMVPFWRERTHVMVGRSTTAEGALP